MHQKYEKKLNLNKAPLVAERNMKYESHYDNIFQFLF